MCEEVGLEHLNNAKQLSFLSALRGISAIWIVLYHARFLPEKHFLTPLWARWFVDVGGMAVLLFFIVSAFSLMYTYPNRLQSRNHLADFYIHRVFRIYPLFLIILIYYIISNKVNLSHSHSTLELFSNFFLSFNLIAGYQLSIVWAGWTVGVEVIFYVMFPFLFKKCDTLLRSLQFLLLSLVLSSLYKNLIPYFIEDAQLSSAFQQWFFVRYLPVFAMGIVCYKFWELRHQIKLSEKNLESFGALLCLSSFLLLLTQPSGITSILGDVIYTQGFAFMMLVFGVSTASMQTLKNKILIWLGKLSYSIYLIHPIVIWQFQDVSLLIYDRFPNSVAFTISNLAIILIVLVISYLTEKFVESPFINLGKKIAKKYFV